MPKLTKRRIDEVACPEKGQRFLRDILLPGFAVRLTRTQKSFVLEKRIHGRVRRIAIGPFGPITVDEARKRAEEMIGRIAKGEDPAQDQLNRRREMTFGELKDLYLERHARPRKRSVKNDESMFKTHLDDWKNRKLSAIPRSEVARLHAEIGKKKPYAANRLMALIRKMFNLARVWGVFNGDNPATGIDLFREKSRDRFVQPNELPGLMKAIAQESNVFIQGAFLVAIMTGARIGEVRSMRWKDVDLDQGIWRLPQTKAGRSHTIPLPKPLLSSLKKLPRYEASPWVFPGETKEGHIGGMKKAWGRIQEGAELSDVRIHDLRRTLGSWLVASGVSLALIGKVLNHSEPKTTQIYARLDIEPVRVALEANAQKMIEVAGNVPMIEEEDPQ